MAIRAPSRVIIYKLKIHLVNIWCGIRTHSHTTHSNNL